MKFRIEHRAARGMGLALLAGCASLAPRALAQNTGDMAVDATSADVTTGERAAQGGPGAVPEDDSSVRLRFTPYAWLTGFNGTVTTNGIGFDIDASFGDIIETSDTIVAFMGAIDVEVGRFVFQINGSHAQAEGSTQTGFASDGGALVVQADVDSTLANTWLEGFGGYRVVDRAVDGSKRVAFDVFAGLRYTQIDLDVRVTSSATLTLPNGQTLVAGSERGLENSEEWVEPFVGARAGVSLSERWYLGIRGDVGGFGLDGSSFAWQVVPALAYVWEFQGGNVGLLAGYRALGQDYESDGFEWDVVTHGPVVGFTIQFVF